VKAEAILTVTGLSKTYPMPQGRQTLFSDLSFELRPSERLGVLGRNGQGKSTLIKILGGALPASAGHVDWRLSPSWPLGFSGGFQGSLTGLDNIRFISRIYGLPMDAIAERTERFAELGASLTMPVKHYSSGMRARLAFGLSLAIEFDCYLIDEIMAVGDVNFQRKCHAELFEHRADRAFIIASHDLAFMQATCDRAIIIEGGRAKVFNDMDEAVEIYAALGAYRQSQSDAA